MHFTCGAVSKLRGGAAMLVASVARRGVPGGWTQEGVGTVRGVATLGWWWAFWGSELLSVVGPGALGGRAWVVGGRGVANACVVGFCSDDSFEEGEGFVPTFVAWAGFE